MGTMVEDVFIVKVGRFCLLFLGLIGALFFYVGLDGVWFRELLDWNFQADKRWLFYAFCFFFIGCGGLIALQCFWYFLFPPILLKVDREGITIATGLRYNPRLFPWKHYKGARLGIDIPTSTVSQQIMAGAQIDFEPSSDNPSWLATSVGISYFNNTITIDFFYANRFSTTTVSETKRLATKFSGGKRV